VLDSVGNHNATRNLLQHLAGNRAGKISELFLKVGVLVNGFSNAVECVARFLEETSLEQPTEENFIRFVKIEVKTGGEVCEIKSTQDVERTSVLMIEQNNACFEILRF